MPKICIIEISIIHRLLHRLALRNDSHCEPLKRRGNLTLIKNFKFIKRGKMKLIINGETKEFNENSTILQVLENLDLIDKVMAAAVNMDIVKQGNWATYTLKEMDKLELLDFVGGG